MKALLPAFIKRYSMNWEYLIVPIAVFIALFNALLPAALESVNHGLLSAASSGFGHSFVIWFCLLLAICLCRDGSGRSHHSDNLMAFTATSTLFERLLTALLIALIMIPSASLSWIICALLSLLWLKSLTRDSRYRRAALIVFAIAIRDPSCQFFLTFFADQILSFDAWLSGLLLLFSNESFQIESNTISQDNGYSLLILTGCSAFQNLSLALLLWLTLSLYRHQEITTNDGIRAALLIVAVLAVNGTRLALMAINKDWYLFLHDGDGALLIDAFIVLFALLCVRSTSHENQIPQFKQAHFVPARTCLFYRPTEPNRQDQQRCYSAE